MYYVNQCIQDGYMVLEIATPLRARNDGGGRWLVPFRRGGVIIDGAYRGTVSDRSLHWNRKIPRFRGTGGFPIIVRPDTPSGN